MELASVPIHFSEQIKYFKSGIDVTIPEAAPGAWPPPGGGGGGGGASF